MSFISHFQLSLKKTLTGSAQFSSMLELLCSETVFNHSLQLLVLIMTGHRFMTSLLKTEKDRMKYFMYFPVSYKRDMER